MKYIITNTLNEIINEGIQSTKKCIFIIKVEATTNPVKIEISKVQIILQVMILFESFLLVLSKKLNKTTPNIRLN